MPRRKQQSWIADLINIIELKNNREEFRVIHSTFSPVPVSRLDELQPREFEKLACWAFQNLGYLQVIHSGAKSTTDGGADVRMRNQKGENEIVQCKQLSRRIDSTELKKFSRAMRIFDAGKGHYWAPAGFTGPAIEYANMHKIIWYDEQRILRTIGAAYKEIERKKQLAIAAGGYVEPKTQPRHPALPHPERRSKGLTIIILVFISLLLIIVCVMMAIPFLGPTLYNIIK